MAGRKDDRDPYATERAEPFTNPEVQALAGVSLMTLHLWRQGTATKARLPARKAAGGRVLFPVRSTLAWMRRHGVVPAVHPDDLGAAKARRGSPPPRSKPVAALLAADR